MAREVHNGMDVIDSRDVIARIQELESERDDLQAELDDAEDDDATDTAQAALDDWDAESGEELKALQSLADEASGSPDWQYGETLISESYFEDYARQLAEDIGAISGNESWPLDCIDWDKACDQLKQDYTEVDFDGVSYYIRS